MKTLFVILLSLSGILCGSAFADTSYKACAENQPTVCATLQFSSPLNTKDEGVFIVTVETPNQHPVKDFKLGLWMQMGSMGHPGAPVDLSDLEQNRYQVQNAWFFMDGTWLVQMNFSLDGTSYHLEIPLDVQE